MAWIKTIGDDEATGVLDDVFQQTRKRAGRVFNIVRVQSVNPKTLQASMGLYQETTLARSPVSRALREMIAVVVSRANECRY